MSPLIQVCLVIIAVTQVVFMGAAIAVAIRMGKAVDNASRAVELLDSLIQDAARTSGEIRKVAGGVEDITRSMKAMAARFEHVGGQAASISSMVLEEVAAPVRAVTAVSRGIRKGVAVVLDRLTRRGGAAAYQGDNHNG